jgi:hypothetical protein
MELTIPVEWILIPDLTRLLNSLLIAVNKNILGIFVQKV